MAGNPPFGVVIYYMIRRKPGNPRATPGDFLELLTRPAPKWGNCKPTNPPTGKILILGLSFDFLTVYYLRYCPIRSAIKARLEGRLAAEFTANIRLFAPILRE